MKTAELIIAALGICLILEGLFPLLFADAWRKKLGELSRLRPGQLRTIGLITVAAGALLLWSAVG